MLPRDGRKQGRTDEVLPKRDAYVPALHVTTGKEKGYVLELRLHLADAYGGEIRSRSNSVHRIDELVQIFKLEKYSREDACKRGHP